MNLLHLLIHGHRRHPWAIDLDGRLGGCSICVRDRILRAIRRQPRRVPPSGF